MLPTIENPTHKTTLPSNGKEVKFRPFRVKEEKNLLAASEQEDKDQIVDAIKQLIQSCVVEPEDLDVNTIPLIDMEWLLVRIRAESKGDTAQFRYKCRNEVPVEGTSPTEYHECGTTNEISVNLADAEVDWKDDHKAVIELVGDIGVEMKYPTAEMSFDMMDQDEGFESQLRMIAKSIDTVWQGEDVYTDFTEQEAIDFIENLTDDQLGKLAHFFQTLPNLKLDFTFVCKECGYQEDVTIEGIENFFG